MPPNPSSGSVSFDRAAGFYDSSRSHSPEVAARVVRPGGVVVVDLTGGGGELFHGVRECFAAAAGLERMHVGVADPGELDASFAALGASRRDLPALEEPGQVSLERLIASFERGDYSYTWRMEDQTRLRAAREVRAWARATYGSLDKLRPTSSTIAWRAYDLPGATSGATSGGK